MNSSVRRNNWNEMWKQSALVNGGVVPSITGFEQVGAMKKHALHGTPITRNEKGFLGSSHLADYRPSSSYNTPYNGFLGADDSNPTTATLTLSMLSKWIAVGVITAILSETIRRMIWKR